MITDVRNAKAASRSAEKAALANPLRCEWKVAVIYRFLGSMLPKREGMHPAAARTMIIAIIAKLRCSIVLEEAEAS